MKYCSKCGKWKNESEFGKNKARKDNLSFWCKECRNQYDRNRGERKNVYAKTIKGKYVRYKSTARIKKHEFNLTREQFGKIILQSCIYCGEPSTEGNLNGVDRIDNSKGYSVDNCAPCCGWCNKMKLAKTKKEFIAQCKKIIKEQKERRKIYTHAA